MDDRSVVTELLALEARHDARLSARRGVRAAAGDPGVDSGRRVAFARAALAELRRHGLASGAAPSHSADLLVATDPGMPEALRQIDYPPCIGLWVQGDRSLLDSRVRVAIVGSRRAHAESMSLAQALAGFVVRRGGIIVSGLAVGVDGAAHRGALDAGGCTIGVLAGGLTAVHPRRHIGLARRMVQRRSGEGGPSGLLVTEYGPGSQAPRPYRFRERNRIIAAISDYVLVVQAHERSGSISTAVHAIDLGIPVGAVPGAIDDPACAGSLRLLADGADCIVSGDTLGARLAAHGLAVASAPSAASEHPLASLLTVPRGAAEVARLAGLDLTEVRQLLLDLELDGLVSRSADGLYVLRG